MTVDVTKGGWKNQILRVDLTTGETRTEPLNAEWARDFVGARGLGSKYFAEIADPNVEPLAPECPLIFATGPLTGTAASCGSRYVVVTKGPLTGALACSNSGGYFGPKLKFAGYDLVIIEGAAATPSYLLIDDDAVSIRSASDVWGRGVWETEDILRTETGMPDASIASIGPAGENLVRFAAILNDRHRAAGRSGVGAVMGSKRLKAIVARGTGGVRVNDPKAFMESVWSSRKALWDDPISGGGLPTYGTEVLVNVINEHGAFPTRNYRESQFEGAEKISGETLTEQRLVANKACFACTIACGRVTALPGEASDKFVVNTSPRNWKIAAEGPEYEAAWALGADTGVDDLDAVIKANWLCNDMGIDPISFGASLAAAMELYETGKLSEDEAGMKLPFGSAEALITFVEKTARRDGFGDALAEGSKRFTAKYGNADLFMGVKGQEFPAYDARAVQGMALAYATSNRGACHLKAFTVGAEILAPEEERLDPTVTEGKAALVKGMQDDTAALDATGICLFAGGGLNGPVLATLTTAATGVAYTPESFLQVGERIWNLERLFNLAAGITSADDTLPRRILKEAIGKGPSKGRVARLGEMLPEYYQLRGWDDEGKPSAEKLAELGL